MKNNKELTKFHKTQLEKVIKSHGVESDYFTYQFFVHQAAKMGMEETNIYSWATKQVKCLHELALLLIGD